MTPPLPPAPTTSLRRDRHPLTAVLVRLTVAFVLALGAAPVTNAADPEQKPMPAPVPPSAATSAPAKPAIDLAVPKVVRTATFALG